jgi:hypothetical protein
MTSKPFEYERPSRDGVWGPEIVVNAVSGDAQLRFNDGRVLGTPPPEPVTNAYMVWLGAPVIVISEGVRAEAIHTVASRLRAWLGLDNVPVVVSMEHLQGGIGTRILVDSPTYWEPRELARAEVYALVQCAWVEAEHVRVQLDGAEFGFDVRLKQLADGRYWPEVGLAE